MVEVIKADLQHLRGRGWPMATAFQYERRLTTEQNKIRDEGQRSLDLVHGETIRRAENRLANYVKTGSLSTQR
jgi:hypothetical protein